MKSRDKVKIESHGDNRMHISPVSADARSNGRALLGNVDWQRVRGQLGLSLRELQVVRHIFAGKTLSDIAQEMPLGLGTIKTYSQRVYRKLDITDRQQLTLLVVRVHLQLTNTVA